MWALVARRSARDGRSRSTPPGASRRPPAAKTGRQTAPSEDRATGGQSWWLWPVFVVAVLATYSPAWHGGVLWDDGQHLTPASLLSPGGFWRIWLSLGATQQYYPVVHSAFWLFHAIWGYDPLGYHLVNIVLHATSAWLLTIVLRRVGARGAALAGVLFALHPVQVESVAWMTELKNTLSGVFYFLAALAYLRFDATRRRQWYLGALALFLAALLSKSVTATLPAGLLVVFWWMRGRIDWRTDVAPLVPFVTIGACAGAFTAWYEHAIIGARGAEFAFPLIVRPLVAARAIWFYLGKLVWPANLNFIYTRWTMSPSIWWQDALVVAVAGALAGAWAMRRRTRAPLAALLFFILTLGPALGFVNVYPFRFSFVADHFQYLACAGMLAFAAAGVMWLGERWHQPARLVELGAAVTLGLPLAIVAFNHSREFADAETLYRATLARNPDCWLAHNNLAGVLILRPTHQEDEALVHLRTALRLAPDYAEAHNNLGVVLQRRGELEPALAEFREAIRLVPDHPEPLPNIATALDGLGRRDEAIPAYREAIQHFPNDASLHAKLGTLLIAAGRVDEGLAEFGTAVRIDPGAAGTHTAAGAALQRIGRLQDAATEFAEAARLQPGSARAHDDLGYALSTIGRDAEAMREIRESLRLDPNYAPAHASLANLLRQSGQLGDAIEEYRRAITLEPPPGRAETHYSLGMTLMGAGNRDAATTEFQTALRVNPNFTPARVALARVR